MEKLAFRIYGSPLYFRDGVKRAEIARRLGLSRQWVTKIIKIYQTEGFDSAVAGKKRGLNEAAASEKRRLSREEEKKVANWIVDKNPAQLKFDFALWTAKAVRQLIYREFGRQLDLSTVRRYLRSWGMTPQRPKKKAIQQDDAAVQRCIRCHTNFRHPFNLSWSGKTCDIRRSSKTTS
ncbi:MAG: winged helix-turn-helix domain-containing protein [Sutterella seckii]